MKLLFLSLIASSAFAIVPTNDVYIMTQDTTTVANYAAQVPGYLSQMNSAMNAADQVKSLKGLSQIQGAGSTLCQLCTPSDLTTMQNYVNMVNTDLCSQFSLALSNIIGTKQAISSLQGIIATFNANPKAAGLALQQASVATQTATQNTLAQIQMLEVQIQQRQIAQEKISKTQQASIQNSLEHAKW